VVCFASHCYLVSDNDQFIVDINIDVKYKSCAKLIIPCMLNEKAGPEMCYEEQSV
jgi:hypothetical protein